MADAIAGTLTSGGVSTTAADVGATEALWVEPLSVGYRGRTVWVTSPLQSDYAATQRHPASAARELK